MQVEKGKKPPPARRLSGALGQRQELQLGHGKMLSVVREEWHLAAQGNGGNGHIGVGKSLAFFLPVPAQQSGLPGDSRGDGQVFEAI
jgi:hypothetical protein